MRLQRIVANRLSRLEGWTYATVGGNSSNFASHLYSFNAWATVSASLLWPEESGKLSAICSLNWEQGSMIDRSTRSTREPSNQKLSVNTVVYRVKYEVDPASEVKWRNEDLSPLTCHCALCTVHCSVLSAWCLWCLDSCWKGLLSSSHYSHYHRSLPKQKVTEYCVGCSSGQSLQPCEIYISTYICSDESLHQKWEM